MGLVWYGCMYFLDPNLTQNIYTLEDALMGLEPITLEGQKETDQINVFFK